ncbi:MAG: glycoside hydrolase TIM-barrel-like domain-containing protein, partial [Pseudomonadota bacterium]
MATIVLAAAGSAVGGAIGGSVLGVSAAAIGQAVGGIAGGLIDQQILGRGSKAVEVGRARSLRLQSSTEGAPMPITFGRIRLAGTVIWSTRFLESVRDTTQGGKATGGGQSVSEYSYSISLAVALCEGPIQRIGRVWADGKLLDTAELTMRVYTGDEEQLPDPKIEAVEGVGNVPSYRGTAYVVFEDLPLGRFGNRIPQLNFEVHRSARLPGVPLDPVYAGEPLPDLIKGVALSPGTGEFALHPEPQHFVYEGGTKQYANVNNGTSRPDMMVALDQLEADLPACDHVSLVVSWFGDDLRCGHCRVEPRVEVADRGSEPEVWSVSGLSTGSARLVSQNEEGRPNYGGTPSDASVVAAIKELKGRGKSVMIYPFLLMDITADNTLPNPHKSGETQPPFPWRGRITLDAAPGQPGSTDQTAAAAGDVDAFFGAARASDFSVSGESVQYSGPAGDWTWRRFVLHLAALGKAAGGVDSIVVGSELIGLTQIRSSRTTYPAVQQLRTLAAEVRSLLPGAKISYAADWSEYFGHHPADGSGDHIFHLDPLWSHPDIDFVGIDDYMSCSDWRHQPTHLDGEAGARSVYSLPYLKSNVAGGENYDWFYGSEADRTAQVRTPIEDTAHGEDWVFRPKDLVNWWSNQHHDRVGGVRTANSTGWVPESKPIWLTETGCPSVDLGANRPNLFFDPKSRASPGDTVAASRRRAHHETHRV